MPEPSPPIMPSSPTTATAPVTATVSPQTVRLIDPDGLERDVPVETAGTLLQDSRWRIAATSDTLNRLAAQAREVDYGGLAGSAKAAGAAVARGVTLGGSDVAARAFGGEDTAVDLEQLREQNPGLSFAGELAGAVLPSLFTGGAAAPAGAAAAVGRGAARVVGGGLRGALVGGATEGALFGVGQGVSELALSRDPLTLEHAAAAIGSNALYGAGAGVVAGGAFKGAEIGLGAAKRALDRALLARSEARAATEAAAQAAARTPAIGTEVDVEYPGLPEPALSAPSVAPPPAAAEPAVAAAPLGRIEVHEIGRTEQMEALFPDGTKRNLGKDGADKFLAEQMPDGFRPAKVETHRDFVVEHGLPATAADVAKLDENAIYIARPSEIVTRDVWGDPLKEENLRRVLQGWKDGERFTPIDAYVTPEGRIYFEDGNHRLAGAAQTDRPVAIRFKDGTGYRPHGDAAEIGERIHSALPAPPPPVAPPIAAVTAEGAAARAKIPLASLDKKGLDLAQKVETERVMAARQPMREQFVELLDEAHKAREPSKEWLSIVGDRNPDKYTREQAKVLFNVDRKVRNLLDNRRGLAERPGRATEWLQQERQALDGLIERGRVEVERFREAARAAPENVRAELLAGKLPGFKVGKGAIPPTSPVIDDIVAREVQARFPRDADGVLVAPKDLQGFQDGRLLVMRNRNNDLQTMIKNLERSPQSAQLTQIEAAREALGLRAAPQRPETSSIGEVLKVAAHAVPFGGLVEKATGALGGLRKAIGAGTERAAKAASTFLGKAAPVAGKAAELAPPVATKVLAALRYGEPETDERGRRINKPEPRTLPELYRARTDEIKSQVHIAPDGTYQMKPAARLKMAARLSGLGVVDPIAADRIESAGAARIAWLASQMPRRPDMAGLPVGPDTWMPSDAAMRSFARKAAAAEDPYGVLERASAGAKARVVPEEIMAMRALHGEILNDYITQVITGLPERKTRLPYPQRLSLSMLTGRPLDPAMTPVVLREIQSMFAVEPGTAGGTMAPRPAPQFGSVKRSDHGTPAQRRQGVGL